MSRGRGIVPKVAVAGVIAVSVGQQRAQAQQPNIKDDRPVGRRGCQPGDRRLGFGHVAVVAAVQQCLHQIAGCRDVVADLAPSSHVVHRFPQYRDGTVAVAAHGLVPCEIHVEDREF